MAMNEVGPTDMAPPKPAPRRATVKVEMAGGHAIITSRDGAIKLVSPAGMVQRRLAPGETVVYFRASVQADTDVVELEERVEVPEEKRW